MRKARAHNPLIRPYTLCGETLQEVENSKYLGVTLDQNLDWGPHLNEVAKKANTTLWFLNRNLKSCPQALKETAYFTLVHPKMEYGAPILNPYLTRRCRQARTSEAQGSAICQEGLQLG